MSKFRSDRKRLPLHPLEKTLLAILTIHLCFLPWALGTVHPWSQITSLCLAVIGFGVALLPRNYTSDYSGGPSFHLSMWPKLFKFPIFWIGLAFLAYIVMQGLNPSWVFERGNNRWWLRRIDDIAWLPTSIDAPFARFNVWRQLIIYTSAWMVVSSLWIGITRRRPMQLLLIILVANGCALALAGVFQHIVTPRTILGFIPAPNLTAPFATFIYHNHAGAYLSLIIVCASCVAVLMSDERRNKMKKSSPAGMFAIAIVLLTGCVLMTLSRGATLTSAIFFVLFAVWFWLRNRHTPITSNRAVTIALLIVFGSVGFFTLRHLDFSDVEAKFARLVKLQEREESAGARVFAHEAGKTMLKDNGMRGVGAGGFRYLFPGYVKKYPQIYQGGKLYWEHAHNDWLEIPIELGLSGCLLVIGTAGVLLVFISRHWFLWHIAPTVIIIGSSQTLLHAWFDFPFQCPAILITWLALLAVSGRWIQMEAAEVQRV